MRLTCMGPARAETMVCVGVIAILVKLTVPFRNVGGTNPRNE